LAAGTRANQRAPRHFAHGDVGLARAICAALLGATMLMSATLTEPTCAQPPQQRPNIVVIIGDDIDVWNIGAYHQGQ
jgi:hypothetical protein